MRESTLDLSRWREKPRGIGYRRWAIVATGLRQLLRTRFCKTLVIAAWTAGLLIAAMGFVFSQSIASGGWLESLATNLGARVHAVVLAVGGWVSLYPDICVGGVFTLIFWVHSFLGLWFSLVALTVVIPRLVSRDRATNALTIYLSRPLTATDYLLGKLGIVVGIVALVWTGPLLFGWLVSMLFAIDRDFVVYSLAPLGRALAFNAVGLVTLSAIALGVSAFSRTSRTTTAVWVALWLICSSLASLNDAPAWLRRSSFTYNLSEVRKEFIRLDTALIAAGENLPLLGSQISESFVRTGRKVQAADYQGALGALGVFVLLSGAVFVRKLKPDQ